MKKLIALILVLGTILFIKYGRSLYMPAIHKVKGKQTVQSVHDALYNKVNANLQSDFQRIGIDQFPDNLTLVGLKKERLLQVYTEIDGTQKLLKMYPFTAFSGKLGPKLKEGDKQIPEGIYSIEYLNPNSSFYLSMKVSYPNAFDKLKGAADNRENLGGDIFIHGKDQTIGCIPIGDEAIEELFLLVNNATLNQVKVIISPHDFRTDPEFPLIDNVAWNEELYTLIREELLTITE